MLRDAPPLADVLADFAAFLAQLDGSLRPTLPGDDGRHRSRSDNAAATTCCTTASAACGTLALPPVIAHNANFDASFLQRAGAAVGWRVVWDKDSPLTCTQAMFRALYPHQAADLTRSCQFCGIDASGRDNRHDALHDAQLCGRLFLRLADAWPSRRA
ncbi:exonuclease [Trypanosoma conorhini]|uniref:Exonuclease n=1 Tax=Trypanosoma conorhini TaxID=83891 RepID=A0A422Q6Z4_9TRYP|nr:exonuclease [Trypanosoma conorhini]RNF25745.1 exonuclease [Trypanosoma conorhini]